MKTQSLSFFLILSLAPLAGCNSEGGGQQATNDARKTAGEKTFMSSYSQMANSLMVSLTDTSAGKPGKNYQQVIVNVDYITVNGKRKGDEIMLGQNIGPVDLLQLKDGLMLSLGEDMVPEGLKVSQIRLILKSDGNFIKYADGTTCALQIPSQVQSGLKILAPNFEIQNGFNYSMVIDFNTSKSLVHQGNGGCLLKPVIKYAGISQVPHEEVDPDGQTNCPDEEEIPAPVDPLPTPQEPTEPNNPAPQEPGPADCDSVNPSDPSTWPENINWEDYNHCD